MTALTQKNSIAKRGKCFLKKFKQFIKGCIAVSALFYVNRFVHSFGMRSSDHALMHKHLRPPEAPLKNPNPLQVPLCQIYANLEQILWNPFKTEAKPNCSGFKNLTVRPSDYENIEYLLEAGQCMKKTVTQQKQPAVKQPPRKTHQVVRRAWLWRSPGILGEFFEFQVMRVKETKWNKRIRLAMIPYSRKFCCSRFNTLSKVWKSFYMFTSCSQGICSQGIASFQDTMM